MRERGGIPTRRDMFASVPLAASVLLHDPRPATGQVHPHEVPGIVCFWDFQEEPETPRVSRGSNAYRLIEMAGPIQRVKYGLFGDYAARISFGQWFRAPRAECPALNIHGRDAQVSVVAWIKRAAKRNTKRECEAVAGMWNESRAKRQYCLFLNLKIFNSSDQVCGHVSSLGGPTPGYRYCMDASIGKTPVAFDEWKCVGFTYDSRTVCSYLDGSLDARDGRNPYPYVGGIFDGGAEGSDFTVAGVDRSNEVGNWFEGILGGLAVYNRALTPREMSCLSAWTNSHTGTAG